ncbi:MAG: hypothetical protein OXI54_07735 [Chloroflexota bacterium]|nr:hypothetical protein [Chloroflexota bacterium]MDE2684024.1 hypothetical protein [Chloroflexota bacterium]
MMRNQLMQRTFLVGSVLALMLAAVILIGCASDTGAGEGRDSTAAVSQGSHGAEEDSANLLPTDATFDAVRAGARLILNYDPASNSFQGAVENITNNTLTNVRVEVHLTNGTELGPTTPVDLAPGQAQPVNLPATTAFFTGWVAHAEVGGGTGDRSGGEHGVNGEHGNGGGEHGSSRSEHGSGGG